MMPRPVRQESSTVGIAESKRVWAFSMRAALIVTGVT